MILTLLRIFAFIVLLISCLVALTFVLFLGLYALGAFAKWMSEKITDSKQDPKE